MNYLGRVIESTTKALLRGESILLNQIRGKKVKAKGATRNPPKHPIPKHRGWKVQDGCIVTENRILATQRNLRWHPGLNVGFGKNGTLFALIPGRVVVTAERFNPNWDHTWIQRVYAGREDQNISKKYFNVLPLEEHQHNRFKLIDEV